MGIAFDGRLFVERWHFAGSWKPGSYPAHPHDREQPLLEPPGVALYTRTLGGRTPYVPGAVEVGLNRFPPALLNGTLTGTVSAVRRHGGKLVPARGAVIQARGFWRGRLLTEAPVGTQITVQLHIPTFPIDPADGIGGGPLLVRDGNPVRQGGRTVHPSHLNLGISAPVASSWTGGSSSWSRTAGPGSAGLTNLHAGAADRRVLGG